MTHEPAGGRTAGQRVSGVKMRAVIRAIVASFVSLLGCTSVPPPVYTPVTTPLTPPEPQERVVYCHFSVERRGIEECPEPLSQEMVSHRKATIALHYKGDVLVRREQMNGSLVPDDNEDRVAIYEYRYEGEHLREVAALSNSRALRFRMVYSPDRMRVDYVSPAGRPKLMWKLVTSETRTFDKHGYIQSRRFFDRLGHPTKNQLGVYELRYTRDERGYWTQIEAMDAAGRPMINQDGFHRVAFERGRWGVALVERYFGTAGEPVRSFGVHGLQASFDVWGNQTQIRYFDQYGQPAVHFKNGARSEVRYDARGNPVENAFFDVQDRPRKNKEGWASRTRRFDHKGRPIESSFRDEHGMPVKWAPLRRFIWDDRDRLVERRYFDENGNPIAGEPSTERIDFDKHDNLVRTRFFDAEGRPINTRDKFTEYRVMYNEDDQPIEKVYFGADGKLADSSRESARAVYNYDEAGKLIKTEYFDPSGNPTERMGARHLVVMYQGATRAPSTVTRTAADARRLAEEAKKRIAEGLSFDEAVALYSDEPSAAARGGDLGIFPRGRMVAEFEQGLLATPVDEVSDVVESPFGFHLILRTQ